MITLEILYLVPREASRRHNIVVSGSGRNLLISAEPE